MKRHLRFLVAVIALALPCTQAETIIALTSGNRLLTVESATPGDVAKAVAITGLPDTESLLAIDFRPFTGGLYALGSSNRLYAIDPANGSATAIGAAGDFQLRGSSFGFDFNPTVDLVRVTSDQDQNLRLNPATGELVSTDIPLAYAATDVNASADPNVVASAYTNSIATAAATTLYDIDSHLAVLAIQNPPNSGVLNTVGPLGVTITDAVGFDISPTTGVAYASMTLVTPPPNVETVNPPRAQLFAINLSTGAATSLGPIADTATLAGETIVDIALPTPTRLLNLSTRGRVGTGDDVLIGGFISDGATNSRCLLRGIGPSLPATLVRTPLADPVLTLFDRNGTIVKTNDDWMTQAVASDLTAINRSGLAPTNNAEAAIFADLAPGAYTAIVSGKNGATGVALVEIYQLP